MIRRATHCNSIVISLFAATCGLFLTLSSPLRIAAQQNDSGTLPSETPAHCQPVTKDFDHERRDAMILMRYGVKPYTVILVPKCAKNAPTLPTRKPYNADPPVSHKARTHPARAL